MNASPRDLCSVVVVVVAAAAAVVAVVAAVVVVALLLPSFVAITIDVGGTAGARL